MTLKTTFTTLGTAGGPVPKLNRAQPAHLISRGDRRILIDCGEGAMDQVQRSGTDFRQVRHIFITHHHFDHIGSLFACLGKLMMMQSKEPLKIYGPIGTRRIIDALNTACDVTWEIGLGFPGQKGVHPRDFVQVQELTPGDEVEIDDIRFTCCENTHFRSEDAFGQDGPVSLSYRIDAPDRSFVFTGDTGPCAALEKLAKGVDVLVGELMDIEGTMERTRLQNPNMPTDRIDLMARHMAEHHLVAADLGSLAALAKVGHVVAVHIPLDTINAVTAPSYVAQIASKFDGEITIANDFDVF